MPTRWKLITFSFGRECFEMTCRITVTMSLVSDDLLRLTEKSLLAIVIVVFPRAVLCMNSRNAREDMSSLI